MLKKEVKYQRKYKGRVKLWKLKDSVVRAAFKKVKSKCNGSEDWIKLETNLLVFPVKPVAKPKETKTLGNLVLE